MSPSILVTEKEYLKAEDIFRKVARLNCAPNTEAELAAAVLAAEARAVIVGVERYTGPLYEALRQTGNGQGAIVARFGVGHDGVDKPLARQNAIVVANTPGVLDLSVAEHAVWLMGCLARRIPRAEGWFRQGEFAGDCGFELHGRRLGILGFGRIGSRVAKIASFGLGMQVWAADVLSVGELEQREGCNLAEVRQRHGLERYTTDLEEVLRECDYVTVHLPALPATRHFVNSARLTLMRASAALINTSRGSLVDEAALYDALAQGRLSGAALDVFEHEPYYPVMPEKDLRLLPNVVLTPHIGSNTREANCRMAEASLANVRHFFDGELERITLVDSVTSPR